MPYITKAEVPKYSPVSGTAQTIGELVDADFEPIEAAASQIVLARTGLAIPADADDTPEAIKLPMVWLIEYIYASMSDHIDLEKSAMLKSNYSKALEMLDEYNRGVVVHHITNVTLEGLYEL